MSNWTDPLKNFKELVAFLTAHGYKRHARNVGWWLSRSKGVYLQVIGHDDGDVFVLADNRKAYNKDGQCPLICKAPESDEQRERLLQHLTFLGTDEAESWSAHLDYLDDRRGMPQSVKESL